MPHLEVYTAWGWILRWGAPTDWRHRHRVGVALICEVADDNFLYRDRWATHVPEGIEHNPADPGAIQKLQAWCDSLVFDADGAWSTYWMLIDKRVTFSV